jgi:hypothetical protein
VIRMPAGSRPPGAPPSAAAALAAGAVRDDLVSLVELPGFVLKACGIGIPADDPISKRPTFFDRDANPAVFAQYQMSVNYLKTLQEHAKIDTAPYDRSLTAIRTAGAKLVEGSDGVDTCYGLEGDPMERSPVSCDPALKASLAAWQATLLAPPKDEAINMSDERRRELQVLGYIK